ncbi:hypothetical protein HK101_010081 [Irineochytrium annulatum]|nr:hypothetical protein HK101_010081 [Irineochytrium annulatum]
MDGSLAEHSHVGLDKHRPLLSQPDRSPTWPSRKPSLMLPVGVKEKLSVEESVAATIAADTIAEVERLLLDKQVRDDAKKKKGELKKDHVEFKFEEAAKAAITDLAKELGLHHAGWLRKMFPDIWSQNNFSLSVFVVDGNAKHIHYQMKKLVPYLSTYKSNSLEQHPVRAMIKTFRAVSGNTSKRYYVAMFGAAVRIALEKGKTSVNPGHNQEEDAPPAYVDGGDNQRVALMLRALTGELHDAAGRQVHSIADRVDVNPRQLTAITATGDLRPRQEALMPSATAGSATVTYETAVETVDPDGVALERSDTSDPELAVTSEAEHGVHGESRTEQMGGAARDDHIGIAAATGTILRPGANADSTSTPSCAESEWVVVGTEDSSDASDRSVEDSKPDAISSDDDQAIDAVLAGNADGPAPADAAVDIVEIFDLLHSIQGQARMGGGDEEDDVFLAGDDGSCGGDDVHHDQSMSVTSAIEVLSGLPPRALLAAVKKIVQAANEKRRGQGGASAVKEPATTMGIAATKEVEAANINMVAKTARKRRKEMSGLNNRLMGPHQVRNTSVLTRCNDL